MRLIFSLIISNVRHKRRMREYKSWKSSFECVGAGLTGGSARASPLETEAADMAETDPA